MANLISISQIYDLNFNINFTHDKCVIFDECGKSDLEGFRSKDNCYTLTKPYLCNIASVNKFDLWHIIRNLAENKINLLEHVEIDK